ncbi:MULTISPECIES: O-antigen polymerase [unclassified Staphylococcus]|uniref:O-antigen polymerase n=1 Tax=unclassified Staphylococcus TaxID=91994 RepID=UPI001AEC51FD|nr:MULTISPECIES: O-antigen polymerase [unclassified Staphylococcus]
MNYSNQGYDVIYILPVTFAFISIFKVFFTPKGILIIIIDMIYFVRLVLINFMVVYSGWYEGRSLFSPLVESYHQAIYLLAIEYIFVNVFYYILVKTKDINLKNKVLKLKIEKDEIKDKVYIFFLLFNTLLILLNRQNISFLGIGQSSSNSIGLDENMLTTLMSISLYVSKYILIGFVIRYFYSKYVKNNNFKYLLYSNFFVLLINMVFIGDNRMDALLPIITSLLLLNYLYGKKMWAFNGIIIFFAICALYLISIIRGTFEYKITSNTNSLITDYLQIYFGGVYNIALSLEATNLNSNNGFLVFLYDIVRPFLGLNFLWRSDVMQMSSTLFNIRIFGSDGHITQIIPLIGQFHMAFGYLGVVIGPLFISLLLRLFLNNLHKTYIIDSIIIITILIRLCFSYFQNLSIFINEMSSLLIIFIVLQIIIYVFRNITQNK